MRVLALDQNTDCGFAIGTIADGVIRSGTWSAPRCGTDYGRRFLAFEIWLSALIAGEKPDRVVFEQPILPANTEIHTLRITYGFSATIETLCERLIAQGVKLECTEAEAPKVRSHFLGRVPQGRKAIKEAVMRMCRARGWQPKDDNEGDALAILDFVLCAHDPKYAMNATPLFGAYTTWLSTGRKRQRRRRSTRGVKANPLHKSRGFLGMV